MNLLLDTHAVLWFLEAAPQLSEAARLAVEDAENECSVSMASGWEMAIKSQMGRLRLPLDFEGLFPGALESFGFSILPIQADICTATTRCHSITAILSTGCSSRRRSRKDSPSSATMRRSMPMV